MPAPLPTLHAMLICDLVIREAGTNKHSAVGIFTDVHTATFPVVLNPLAVYACLSDAMGDYELAIELVDLQKDHTLGRIGGLKMRSDNRLASHDFGMRLVNTVFPRPSTYEFRLLADDRILGSRTVRVHQQEQRQ